MTDDSKILELEEKHRAVRRARLARFRKWLRYLPRRSNVGRYPIIRNFAEAARKRPYLWAFRSVEVRRAIYLGTVISFLPVYGLHTLVAFGAAILFRANLGVALGVQIITNPITAPPLYYVAYRVGMWFLGLFVSGPHPPGYKFYALLVGGIMTGLVLAVLLDLLVKFAVWEAKRLRERHLRVKLAADQVRARGTPESGTLEGGTDATAPEAAAPASPVQSEAS